MTGARPAFALASLLLVAAAALAEPQTEAGRIADQAIRQRFGTEPGATTTRTPPDAPIQKAAPTTGRSGELTLPGDQPVQPVTTSAQREQLALGGAPSQLPQRSAGAARTPSVFDHWIIRTAGALALVIGLILLCKKFFIRMSMNGGGVASQFGAGGRAPSGVLEILARYPVSRGHTLVLLKMDRRVLLLGHSAQGFNTLAELTDSEEVASILVKTRDEEGETMTARFNALLRGMERDPSTIAAETEPQRPAFAARAKVREEAPELVTRRAGLSAAATDLAQRLEALRGRGKGMSA